MVLGDVGTVRAITVDMTTVLSAEKLATGRNGSSRITFVQNGDEVIVRANSTDRTDGETLWSRFVAFKSSGYTVRFLNGCAPEPVERTDPEACIRLRGSWHRVNKNNPMAFSLSK